MLVLQADVRELEQTLAFDRGAAYPLITMAAVDPRYLEALLDALAKRGVEVFSLDLSMGFVEKRANGERQTHSKGGSFEALYDGLDHFALHAEASEKNAVLLLDLSAKLFDTPELTARIDALAARLHKQSRRARVLSPVFESPWATSLDLSPPVEQAFTQYVDEVVSSLSIDLTSSQRLSVIEALRGLLASDIYQILESASYQVERVSRADSSVREAQILEHVERARRERLVARVGLEVIPRASAEQMGGMEVLKRHLEYDAVIFRRREDAIEQQLALPKGILLVGLPGCGKSLAAKVSASMLDLPLLRLDVGSLMGKYLGESEERMRRALDSVEASAPCVLWIDELEKALGGSAGEGTGTDTRMLGLLLTWMQENDFGVYVVATANSVEKLPPELLRRGRFDESFFVGLPNERERLKILEIHLEKRSLGVPEVLARVAGEPTEGFSGAEIEALVKAAHRQRFVQRTQTELSEDLVHLARHMTPFSRQWEAHLERMMRPLKEQGFKNASLSGQEHELPPVPEEPLPRALQVLLDAPGAVVLSPRQGDRWTMELSGSNDRIELRLCQQHRHRVKPGDADAVATLRAEDGSLRGRLLSSLAAPESAEMSQEIFLSSDESGDIYARFANSPDHAYTLDAEFLSPVATGEGHLTEDFPPALYGCLNGVFSLELRNVTIDFTGNGARREAVISTKQGDKTRYRVRARGASVLLGGLEGGFGTDTLELVWNGEEVRFGSSTHDNVTEPEPTGSDYPPGFRGIYNLGEELRISPKIYRIYRLTFEAPFGGGEALMFISLRAGKFAGFIRIGEGAWQSISGKAEGGEINFNYDIGGLFTEVSCALRSRSDQIFAITSYQGMESSSLDTVGVMRRSRGSGVSLVLVATGIRKIPVIEALKNVLGISVKSANAMSDSCPVLLESGMDPSKAIRIVENLERLGARAIIV